MPSKRQTFVDPQRDLPLLKFLWDWKVSTTAALCQRFYSDISPATAYYRLKKLERGSLIVCLADETGKSFVWSLTKIGFDLVRGKLPPLREEGFKSEFINHDLFTAAFQIGDWLAGEPDGVEFITEQQLRRFDFEFYSDGIPKTTDHRADGYTLLKRNTSPAVVAIEVELTPKGESDYDRIAEFYDRYLLINDVLWLIPSLPEAKRIGRIFAASGVTRKNLHSFALTDEFEKLGWGAKFKLGAREGQSIREVMCCKVLASSLHATAMQILDRRKCRTSLGGWRSLRTPRNSD